MEIGEQDFPMNAYQRVARRFINKNLNQEQTLLHGLHGLCAEVGEVHSLYQKFYQGHELSSEHLEKELGDVLWFLAEVATANGLELGEIARTNIDKLSARYPNGFNAEQSLRRKEGDI